ncbi:MAG: DegV family protein, partial [Bacillota bacterium]|nr:DegV family protein [Bacillota bacterium]
MSVKIIVDSCSDIKPDEAEKAGLCLLPLSVSIDGCEYLDGVTITHNEFYTMLEKCKTLPSTSQITPYSYEMALDEVMKNGDDALIITISSKLSGTYSSAVIAAEKYKDKVYVTDSESATIGEKILVEYAVKLKNDGLSAKEIYEKLEQCKKNICVIALVDTLEYLQKGGRISKTASVVGGMLGIKPVLAVKNGEVVMLGKARGSKQSNNYLNELIKKSGNIDFSMPYMLGYSGLDDTPLKKYISDSKSVW